MRSLRSEKASLKFVLLHLKPLQFENGDGKLPAAGRAHQVEAISRPVEPLFALSCRGFAGKDHLGSAIKAGASNTGL